MGEASFGGEGVSSDGGKAFHEGLLLEVYIKGSLVVREFFVMDRVQLINVLLGDGFKYFYFHPYLGR